MSPTATHEKDADHDTQMDCSTTTAAEAIRSPESNSNDDHSLPSNSSSTARMISVCEIRPSFYLTTPIRRLFDSATDQSTPNDPNSSTEYTTNTSSTSSFSDYQQFPYSDVEDENNKENSSYPSTLTPVTLSADARSPPEVKKSSIYKLILKYPSYH